MVKMLECPLAFAAVNGPQIIDALHIHGQPMTLDPRDARNTDRKDQGYHRCEDSCALLSTNENNNPDDAGDDR
jgi:hypothetical protein